MLLNVYLEMH
jgi:hypothetical protein